MHLEQIKEKTAEFSRLGCQIVAIHYYKEMQNQEKWREFAQCEHRQLADPDRVLYRQFGIGRLPLPTSKWSTRAFALYGGRSAVGIQIYSETEQGDVAQAGGDVIVSKEGKVVYSYRPSEPNIRPEIPDILSALERVVQ